MNNTYIPYNLDTMTIDQYNTLDQTLRDIVETYGIVVKSIINKDKINAICACGCSINTKLISNFLSENICCASCTQLKHGMEILQEFAANRNGECLSVDNYKGSKSYYLWKCNNCCNEWSATWHSVCYMKSWCPTCASSISENICRHALEEITGHKFHKISNFSKTNTTRGFEIDCYNKELKVGVEYDGIQHHKHTAHFHGASDSGKFEAQQDRDRNKTSVCDELGITLLRVNYTTPRKKLRQHIHELIRGLNLPIKLVDPVNFISDIEFNNNVSKICSNKSAEYIKRIMDIVVDKKAILHSTSCDSWKSPIEITCKNGHKFTTNLDRLLNVPPRWCPDCAHNRTLKTEHILAILEPKGFELTGMKYQVDKSNRNRLYISYICDTYHNVTVMWDNHSSPDDRCPDCVAEEAVDQADANALIREENRKPGLKDISHNKVFNMGYDMDYYNNAVNDLIKIRCLKNNHIFYDKPHNLIYVAEQSECDIETNSAKEFCSQCILKNDFPNLEVDYTKSSFKGSEDLIYTTCIECSHEFISTNKSIPERTQCCKNVKCIYNDNGKKWRLGRSRDKNKNKYGIKKDRSFRTMSDMDQIIKNSELTHQGEQYDKLRIEQSKYQNNPDYIISVYETKFKYIDFECIAHNHKFRSKIATIDKYPDRELCAQCIIKYDYPHHQLSEPFEFTDNTDKFDSKNIHVKCKCGQIKSIQHGKLRVKTINFCTKKCLYYNKQVRDINKYNNIMHKSKKSATI